MKTAMSIFIFKGMRLGMSKIKFSNKKKYLLIALFLVSGLGYAARDSHYQFSPPKKFIKEKNIFPKLIPTQYFSPEGKKISIMIPPSYKLSGGVPMTKEGKLAPEFIAGKKSFNSAFGISEWHLANYSFTNTANGKKLELVGSYRSNSGKLSTFIERHFFNKEKKVESIHLIYDEDAKEESIQEAKSSLETYQPSFQ